MGRNFPSATELVRLLNSELQHFADMLPPQDRIIIKRFTELALNNRAAIANAATLQPLEILLLLVLLDEHKKSERRYDELRAELDRLKADTPP